MKATILPVNRDVRRTLALPDNRYDTHGRLIINTAKEARELALLYAEKFTCSAPSAANLFAAAHIVTAWEYLLEYFAQSSRPFEQSVLDNLPKTFPDTIINNSLTEISEDFPDNMVWNASGAPNEPVRSNPAGLLRIWTLLNLAQNNPAFTPFGKLFCHPERRQLEQQQTLWAAVESIDRTFKQKKPENSTSLLTLRKPLEAAPHSVKDQLMYILLNWEHLLGDLKKRLLGALDMIAEENRPSFSGPGPAQAPGLDFTDAAARFSDDDEWMPRVVLLAKNALVWLNQLSRSYGRDIQRLNEIPDRELEIMASRGFNTLWLIGLWERSPASREIKRRMGNPEAAASAYSLFSYDIAWELGGWEALENLRSRAAGFGIRLSSDMVPNHVGIDSDWVRHHPERLLQASSSPFPTYSYFSDNLSGDDSVDIRLEDHYWQKSDAAVVFQRCDTHSGEMRYIYHGNDGTSMPWNDTAQIDFLNPEAREAVIQDILHVARNFPVIRFDAAMVLARKQIRRLWFPAPGAGGSIPSRSESALDDEAFNQAIPHEFWREVVDRVAAEVPGTLLLAEAFWMMESYFVRTLGMHRVYNSAFMHMLRDQNNGEYRSIIKKTLEFDPGILQRFVNFMNNPDEETAIDQFDKDDRYFAACTLLATLPGLPMFGHGQIEGFSEKYGMEYVRAYRDENPDSELLLRHEKEIFPLLTRRYLFAGAESFRFYDFHSGNAVCESVYAFTNTFGGQQALVVVNNAYERVEGIIKWASTGNAEIASSLLGGNPDRGDWLLRKDMISGLWFLRSVASLQDYGLDIRIDGFGRHVCLEFRRVTETEDGMWANLASEIGIHGMANPDAALRELRLRPVKRSLESLLSSSVLVNLAQSIRAGRLPQWPQDTESIYGALNTLYRFRDSRHMESDEMIRQIRRKLSFSSKLWRFFHRGVRRRLARCFGLPDADEAVFLAAYSILSVCAEGMWYDWNLEALIKTRRGVLAHPEIQRSLECALLLPGWTSPLSSPSKMLRNLFSMPDIRRLCAVNSWEGQIWYNLEGWNTFVRAAILSGASESLPHRYLKRLIRRWYRAHRKANYSVEALLNNVVDGLWWSK